MKLFVALDTIDSQNLGCQLVSAQLRTLLSSLPEVTEVIYSSAYKNNISLEEIEEMKNCDAVYINGEGSCNGAVINDLITNIMEHATRFQKPIYFCNFTFDPRVQFGTSARRQVLDQWKTYFEKCKIVAVRDPISYRFLKNHGCEKVVLYPDIGTSFETSTPATKTNTIMLGVGAITKKIHTQQSAYRRHYQQIVDHFSERYHFLVPDWPNNPVSDGRYLQNLKGVTPVRPTFKEYYDLCKSATLNITGRHHGTVMSHGASCPFVTFRSNMWKTEADNILYGSLPFLEILDIEKQTYDWITTIEKVLSDIDVAKNYSIHRREALAPYHTAQVKLLTTKIPDMALDPNIPLPFDAIDEYLSMNCKID